MPDSSGIKGSAVNLPPALGGCEKEEVSFLGSPIYTVANSQEERGEIILVTLLHFLLPSLPWPSIHSDIDWYIDRLIDSSIYLIPVYRVPPEHHPLIALDCRVRQTPALMELTNLLEHVGLDQVVVPLLLFQLLFPWPWRCSSLPKNWLDSWVWPEAQLVLPPIADLKLDHPQQGRWGGEGRVWLAGFCLKWDFTFVWEEQGSRSQREGFLALSEREGLIVCCCWNRSQKPQCSSLDRAELSYHAIK